MNLSDIIVDDTFQNPLILLSAKMVLKCKIFCSAVYAIPISILYSHSADFPALMED